MILVFEDSPLFRKRLSDIFGGDYELVFFYSLEEFLSIKDELREILITKADFVFIDHNLQSNKFIGSDVSRLIKELNLNIIQIGISSARSLQKDYIEEKKYFGKTRLEELRKFITSYQ